MPHIESALAVLKTIGLTQRQLAATIAWQATVGAIIGIAASVPLGIALGPVALDLVRPADLRGARTHRAGRDANRRNSRHLVLANLMAALPGRHPHRQPRATCGMNG
jgi:hypothetical protein